LQRYHQSGSTADRQRSGGPRITSAAQDRYIRVLQLRNRTVTARETASNDRGLRRISAQIVRNRLRENGLRAIRSYFGTVLRRRLLLARVRWCNRVRDWDLQTEGESGSAMNQDSCCRKEMAVHVSTDAGIRGSHGTASLRSTISAVEV